MKIGFYYNCYKNRYATDKVLENTRKIYPNNPIFLMNDKGDDFTDIAIKYNCEYYYSNINILGGCEFVDNGKTLYRMGFPGEKEAKLYLKYILKAIEYCNTEYLILLEDDVYINDKVKVFPNHAGGDKNSNNRFCHLLKNPNDFNIIKKEYPKSKIDFWNLAGGSILHCETIKKCIKNTSFSEIMKFDQYYVDNHEPWHTNDCILNYILLINGYTCDKWTNTSQSNIKHPDKRFYNKNLSIEDGVYRK